MIKKRNYRKKQSLQLTVLLPLFAFLLASVFFVFPIPAQIPAEGNSTPSMNSTGYNLRASIQKTDFNVAPFKFILPTISLFLFVISQYRHQTVTPVSVLLLLAASGIRAPPQ